MEFKHKMEIQITVTVNTNIRPPRRLNRVSDDMENFISNISNQLILTMMLLYGFSHHRERGERTRSSFPSQIKIW